MSIKPNHELIRRYWQALNARAWSLFRSTLSESVVYEVPQTRERIRGLEPYVDFNATFPGDWTIEIVRVVADDTQAAGEIIFRVGGEEMTRIAFFKLSTSNLKLKDSSLQECKDRKDSLSEFVEGSI